MVLRRSLIVGVIALGLTGAACDQELKGYDGRSVDEVASITIAQGGCPILNEALTLAASADIPIEVSRALYQAAEPALGSDEFEGAVFDQLVEDC